MTKPLHSLPLISSEPTVAADWHGFSATAAPEPELPQGEYSSEAFEAPLSVPLLAGAAQHRVELLAPAGGPDAAFAAFHYGADAIYLGLKKFSARAEAENFTLDELAEVTAYAHSLTPRRRVFVTVNTVIRQDELAELIDDLAALADIGVDALIIQDLGVYHLVRRYFPELELHASTQLAVHNRAGAEALKRLGFTRVVLARELTFEEVRDITAASGIETEVFIHGALCYSYSGLCLFSAQTLGRSGNRGKCAYSCRDSFDVTGAPETLRDGSATKRDPTCGFPFSMKDLALPDHLPALRAAGVSCFKVEGRKKSPLYVATTTDYYRKLLDGRLSPEDRPEHEADMQAVFSRPWTRLFVHSHKDKEVADRDTVGHRGTRIGTVESVRQGRLRFRTKRAVERHDGLQIDLPALGKPFGFAVDHLWIVDGKKAREEFEAPAGSHIEVALPAGHPQLPVGAPVYCSSSQAVKRRYRHDRPKPGLFRTRKILDVAGRLGANEFAVVGRVGSIVVERKVAGSFESAREPGAMAEAFRGAFEKLGASRLTLGDVSFDNPDGRFVPVSRLNQLRRELVAAVEEELQRSVSERAARVKADICLSPTRQRGCGAADAASLAGASGSKLSSFRWLLKLDRIEYADTFETSDWEQVDEVIVDIARDHPAVLAEKLEVLEKAVGRERIRLALPPLTRKWEEKGIVQKIERFRGAGWNRWEAGNLSAWSFLDVDSQLDLSTDWSVYVVNRAAARQLLDMGVRRFTLSPEDGLGNLRSLLAEFGDRAVLIVHQDTPLFLAESCAYANLIGGCPGKANCKFESMEMVSSEGEKVTALDYHCRTIVLNQGPFCIASRWRELAAAGAKSLRVDFIYRKYEPIEVRERWRAVRAGRSVPGGHAANFERGML
jgi:putative protease